MPIYEYKCANCDNLIEKMQKMDDKPLKKCPACKKMKLTKQISASGFRIQGAGVYKPTSKLD